VARGFGCFAGSSACGTDSTPAFCAGTGLGGASFFVAGFFTLKMEAKPPPPAGLGFFAGSALAGSDAGRFSAAGAGSSSEPAERLMGAVGAGWTLPGEAAAAGAPAASSRGRMSCDSLRAPWWVRDRTHRTIPC